MQELKALFDEMLLSCACDFESKRTVYQNCLLMSQGNINYLCHSCEYSCLLGFC